MSTFYRYDTTIQQPLGPAVPGASVAVLTDPSDFSTQPGSPLAALYAASSSNSANVTAAVWAAQQITFMLDAVPADVVTGSYFGLSGASPSSFNTDVSDPWLVLGVNGNQVVVQALTNPGTWVSGGVVASSALPNPTFTDGNGHAFFYAAAGLYGVQVYGPIDEQDYPDQGVGTVAGGSVTSVALTAPAEFSVTGSPITTNGTIAIAKANQNANTMWAGPSSGVAAVPSFRVLVAADIPSLGYVTSVGLNLTVPSSILSLSQTGSPVTGAGTIAPTITLQTQGANQVWAGPLSGSAATPTFRVLAPADLPGATVFSATLTLTSAQLKALHATPIQIVPAPGAGLALMPLSATAEYVFVTPAYSGVTNAIIVIAPAATLGSSNEPIQMMAAGFIDQTASQLSVTPAQTVAAAAADFSNTALMVANEQGSGEFTTGNGSLKITLYYTVITL